MTQVILVGDIHGDRDAILRAYKSAVEHNAKHLVFMGDFGLSWRNDTPCNTMEFARVQAKKTGVMTHILLGNHENWNWHEINQSFNDVHLKLLDRSGVVWIDGHPVAYQAGGCSIDQHFRTPGKSWWPEELPTEDDYRALQLAIDQALEMGKGHDIQLFLAHDSATPPPMRLFALPGDLEMQCFQSRDIVKKGMQYSHADLLVHGHFHFAYDSIETHWKWKQMGLNKTDHNAPNGMININLDTLEYSWI